jgi:multidrug efflux pump subunit AcrB
MSANCFVAVVDFSAINLDVVMDQTVRVGSRIEATLTFPSVLVVLVVSFSRNVRSTIIPSIARALSLVGTSVMYLGYSLDNLSLMALAISTGFVVDDAIVVLET